MALLYWLCEHTLIIHPEVSEACPRLTTRQVTSVQLNEESDEELDDIEEEEKEDAENAEDEEQEDAEEEEQEVQEQEQQKQEAENTQEEEEDEEEEEDGQYAEECHQEQKPANEDFNDFCNIIINDAPEGEEQIHQQTLEKLQTENNNLQLDNTVKTIYINKLEEDNRLLTAQIQQLKDENSRLHNQLVEKEVHEITQEVCAVKYSGTDAKNEGHTINDENSQVLQKEVHENSEVVDKELHQKEVHENSEVVDKELHQKENQLLEEDVHDLTQQVCAIKADDLTELRQTKLQNSMIKNIKAKARKTTEVSDYEYRGKKVKVEKEKEHKDETILNKYAVTIDAYAEILQREPQAHNSSDGAEHNGKSFILSTNVEEENFRTKEKDFEKYFARIPPMSIHPYPHPQFQSLDITCYRQTLGDLETFQLFETKKRKGQALQRCKSTAKNHPSIHEGYTLSSRKSLES
ncbi:unnamed protein product [Camellia sinensis]